MPPHLRALMQACLLVALGTSLVILGETYSTMVFLGRYPAQELPYFYLALGVFAIVTTQLINPWVKQNLAQFIKISHALVIVILFGLYQLMSSSVAWAPFLFTITLATVSMLVNTSYWAAVVEMFDLREFKRISHIITALATVGGIVTGIITPILLRFLPSISLLITYCIIIAIVIPLVHSIIFRQPSIEPSNDNRKLVIGHRSLLTALFVSIMLMILLFTGADFIMKFQLAQVFNKEQIGSFLAPFYAVTMVITVFAQYFMAPILIRKTGIAGMMTIFPLLLLLGSIALIWQPSFWTAIAIGGLAQIGRYSFYSYGKQLALNVLPRQLRRAANFQLQSVGRNVATILASLGLSYITYIEGYSLLIWVMAFLSGLMLAYVFPIKKAYYRNLQQAINVHRFAIDYFLSQRSDEAIRSNVIEYAFDQNTTDSIIFGLSLYEGRKLTKIPMRVLTFITHDSKVIQGQVLALIRNTNDPTMVDYLMQVHSQMDSRQELSWRISDVILGLDPQQFLPLAALDLDSDFIPIKSRAISTYLLAGNAEQHAHAKQLLFDMMQSKDIEQRHWAVKILRITQLAVNDEQLLPLLQDDNLAIQLDAIDVVVHNVRESTINAVLTLLFDTHTRGRAIAAVVNIGDRCLERILEKIEQESNPVAMRVLIDTLSQMPSAHAEQALVHLLRPHRPLTVIVVAYHLTSRMKHYPPSKTSKQQILNHIMRMKITMNTLLHAQNTNNNEIILFETQSYIYRLRRTFLLLLSVLCEDKVITKMMPVLLSPKIDAQRYAKAIELLELRVQSSKLKDCITHFIEAKKHTSDIEIIPLNKVDPWFNQVEQYLNHQLTGDDMERVHRMLVLRKISLFENLTSEALQMIAENLEKVDASEGEVLFNEGDVVSGLFILANGSVDVKKGDNIIATYSGPDFFGELGLFANRSRAASAIATSDAELYTLDKAAFDHITDEWPEILRGIVNKILTYME